MHSQRGRLFIFQPFCKIRQKVQKARMGLSKQRQQPLNLNWLNLLLLKQGSITLLSYIFLSAWGSGWGVSAKASFQYSNNMKMSSNEVILIATHVIDLGKAFIDPSNFILTENAQELLAIDSKEFTKKFGTHFLAGCTTECSMQVYFRRTGSSSDSKKEIAA